MPYLIAASTLMPTAKTATGSQKWRSVRIAFHNGCFNETSCS
jgi:hypothetical protein